MSEASYLLPAYHVGEKQFLSSMVPFEANRERARFSEETRESMIDAAYAMGKVKTGALIVVEQVTHAKRSAMPGAKGFADPHIIR